MAQLINDLLDLCRLGRQQLNKRAVDLSAMAQAVANQLQEQIEERQVEFRIAEGMLVSADPHLLRIVMVNLLGNALKFTGTRCQAWIDVGSLKADEEQVYFVRDNGVGFDMAHASKLFGVFERLHRTDEFPGTGIGLATVQRIVTRHRGRIWAEGAVDQGAAFYFTLGGNRAQ